MLICPNILYSRDSSISQIKLAGNSLKIKQVCGSTAQSLNLQYSLNFQKAMYSVSFSHFQIRIFHKNVSRKIKLLVSFTREWKNKVTASVPIEIIEMHVCRSTLFFCTDPPPLFLVLSTQKRGFWKKKFVGVFIMQGVRKIRVAVGKLQS